MRKQQQQNEKGQTVYAETASETLSTITLPLSCQKCTVK